MATMTQTASLTSGRSFIQVYSEWRAGSQKRRLFARTLRELSSLTDRELSDLGLSRASLRAAAHEAVYG